MVDGYPLVRDSAWLEPSVAAYAKNVNVDRHCLVAGSWTLRAFTHPSIGNRSRVEWRIILYVWPGRACRIAADVFQQFMAKA
jgi:hypothetical protein